MWKSTSERAVNFDFHTGHHEWYEKQGKYLEKKNTFHDFVDCARYLKEQGISGDMSCEGRSAGGLLVGNAVNLAPEAFNACIAGVPFVDLMTTMCDPSIPLTTEEWEEWGNPNEKKYHDYMLSYSPIDNVKAGVKYPAMLLVSGLNDPRVACWAVWKATSASGARQFFTKSFLGDDAPMLAPSSGEEPTSPRHRAGVASIV